ncbi:hypothetical protein FHT87_005212 [Rhizobium sp. BK316]|uniref:hypothetical protein n=1 Tax=Rhizobium sp. BK316 TaxID=2587053 RepID=UPI001614B04F|nr:hypothetical protein [Rhizobium sp. BK316]MBB3411259.1 hypothetical protein [Rhizobium sp. BK316]
MILNEMHMMPRTRAAHERLSAQIEARRAADFKADIDSHLLRWSEPPCTLDEARWYDKNEPNTSARDAAEDIMFQRY